MKKITRVLYFIFGIYMIIGGFYCLFKPGLTYLSIGYVIGISMILDAIVSFMVWWETRKTAEADGWMLASSILSAVFGFFVLNNTVLQLGLDAFIIYYIAVWFVIRGIFLISRAAKVRRLHKTWDTKTIGTHWYLPLILGILLILFGILSMFKPLVLASTIGVFIGLGIISFGADMITLATTPDE